MKPIFTPKRNVPLAVLEPINKELDQLEKLSALSKVEYSNWAVPILYVKKEKLQNINLTGFFNWFE